MDDWNRHEECWEMNCPECQQNFRLYIDHYRHKGLTHEVHLWVPTSSLNKVKHIEKQLETAKAEVTEIATVRYTGRWLQRFEDAKTKKEVWRRLTGDGKRRHYPSLSTFYDHVRRIGLEVYLRNEFTYNNLPDIMQSLAVVDSEIHERREQISAIESDLDQARRQLKKVGYK
jgi:hypothetical protein